MARHLRERLHALVLDLQLALAYLRGPLQRFEVRLLACRDGDLRAFVGPRLCARQQTVAGDQFADLVVRHPLLTQRFDAGLAAEELLAERLALHLVELRLKPLLGGFPVVVDDSARRDHARGEQRVGIQARQIQRRDRPRQRHDPVGQRVGRERPRDPQRNFAELRQPVGVLFQPADHLAERPDERGELVLELRADVLPQVVELAPERRELAFGGLRPRGAGK